MVIFHHIYQVNQWEEIVEEQKKLVGEIPDHQYIANYTKEGDKGYELPTLQKLWEYCQQAQTNEPICYIHTKGVTTPKRRKRRLWRETLNYWVLRRWQDNVVLLEKCDMAGARAFNFKMDGHEVPHYSGNFWWANSDYIKGLPSPTQYIEDFDFAYSPDGSDHRRFGCEFWVGSAHPKMGVVDNYIIDHIRQITRYKGLESFRKLKRKFG